MNRISPIRSMLPAAALLAGLAPGIAVAQTQTPPPIDDNPGAKIQGTAPPGVPTPAPVPGVEPTGSGTAGTSPAAIPDQIAPVANLGGETRLAPTGGAPPITGSASQMRP